MKGVLRQNQLYTFLLYCNDVNLEKKVLDCGAGGNLPPLSMFAENGYETYGIEISKEQIMKAKEFEDEHKLKLGIEEGDMKSLPFEDESMSFVYSYNSIFHMSKQDIKDVIREIYRVLPSGGLAFVNFASTNDFRATLGEKVGDGEYLQVERGQKILHSYFDEKEAEEYFDGFKIVYKENRIRDLHLDEGSIVTLGFIDYIIKK